MQSTQYWAARCTFHDAPLLHWPIRWTPRKMPGESRPVLCPVFGCYECAELATLARSINESEWE